MLRIPGASLDMTAEGKPVCICYIGSHFRAVADDSPECAVLETCWSRNYTCIEVSYRSRIVFRSELCDFIFLCLTVPEVSGQMVLQLEAFAATVALEPCLHVAALANLMFRQRRYTFVSLLTSGTLHALLMEL